MAIARLVHVTVAGVPSSYPIVEAALSHLRCVDVTDLERHDLYFVLSGWVPEIWLEELREVVEKGTGGHATVEREPGDAAAEASAPLLLENPRWTRPFEYLNELFTFPGRPEYDPTALTFLGLTLFFGFAVADLGHGLFFLAAGLLLRRRVTTPLGRFVSALLSAGGAWAALLGALLYAEFFGFSIAWGPLALHPLERLTDAPVILGASLAVGLLHVGLGLVLGFRAERRRVGFKAAALGKLAWLLLEAGLVLLGLAVLGLAASLVWLPGLALAGLAIGLLGIGGGLPRLLEVPPFLGNLLSYLRLGMLALGEGVLALAFNRVTVDAAIAAGPVGWLVGGLVFLIAHGALLGLSVFFVTLNALRLHYVEFYPKIYGLEAMGSERLFQAAARPPRPHGDRAAASHGAGAGTGAPSSSRGEPAPGPAGGSRDVPFRREGPPLSKEDEDQERDR